jgi:hypothetical protein
MSLLLSRKIQGKHAVVLFNGSVLSPLVIMVGIALLDAWTTPIYLFSSESADGLKKIYIFEVCGLTLSLVCMTAIRLCGYRLIRVQKTGPRKPTAWRRMGASLAFLSPLRMVRRIPPFPSLIAAILLAAIALCWPARIIHQANEKFARERAVEEERKRIGTPYVPQNQQKF